MPKPYSSLPESQVTPEPKLEKRKRRQFTREYKLKIITLADACEYGELGVLLRQEKLYSSQLLQWRRELAEDGEHALGKTAPGPKATKTPEQRRIEDLERENSRLVKRLAVAEACIDLQKKTLEIVEHASNGSFA